MKNYLITTIEKKTKFAIFIFVSITIIYSCHKNDLPSSINYKSDESFFKRNDSLSYLFTKINGTDADNNLFNKIISGLKKYDQEKQIVESIKTKFGKPLWDISIVLKNTNNLKTIVTPVVNEQKSVTALIFFYQNDSTKTTFKIVNRLSTQNRLRTYGNKEATLFTKASLEGLFKVSDKNLQNASAILISQNNPLQLKPVTQSITITWICWYYVWYTADNFFISNTQCSYSVSVDSMDIATMDGSGAGTFSSGEGGGGEEPSIEPQPCETDPDVIEIKTDFESTKFIDGENNSQPQTTMEISNMPIGSKRGKIYTPWIIGTGGSMLTSFKIVSTDMSTQFTNSSMFWEFESLKHGKALLDAPLILGYSVDLAETANIVRINPYLYQVDCAVNITYGLLYKCMSSSKSGTIRGRKFYTITDGQ